MAFLALSTVFGFLFDLMFLGMTATNVSVDATYENSYYDYDDCRYYLANCYIVSSNITYQKVAQKFQTNDISYKSF